jgi:hypothetical protein
MKYLEEVSGFKPRRETPSCTRKESISLLYSLGLNKFYIVTCTSEYTEFGLVTGFIDLLQLVINYNTISISHTLQFTTART